jgi:hypothetical protein
MMPSGMQGNDIYGGGLHGGGMMHGGGMHGGGMMVPSNGGGVMAAAMYHPHSRDPSQFRQLQISDGSDSSAEGGGNGYGYAAPRFPHQQSGSFPFGGGS